MLLLYEMVFENLIITRKLIGLKCFVICIGSEFSRNAPELEQLKTAIMKMANQLLLPFNVILNQKLKILSCRCLSFRASFLPMQLVHSTFASSVFPWRGDGTSQLAILGGKETLFAQFSLCKIFTYRFLALGTRRQQQRRQQQRKDQLQHAGNNKIKCEAEYGELALCSARFLL